MSIERQPINTEIKVPVADEWFLGAAVPERVVQLLEQAMTVYPHYIEHRIPPQDWYLSFAHLGEVPTMGRYFTRFRRPLPQAFTPTAQLTHVGRGRPTRQELWAFVEPTPVLLGLRDQLIARLKKLRLKFLVDELREEFVPHITIGRLFAQVGHLGIADVAAVSSFSIQTIHLYRRKTTVVGSTVQIEQTIDLC